MEVKYRPTILEHWQISMVNRQGMRTIEVLFYMSMIFNFAFANNFEDKDLALYNFILNDEIDKVESYYELHYRGAYVKGRVDLLVYSARTNAEKSVNYFLKKRYFAPNFSNVRNEAFFEAAVNGNVKVMRQLQKYGVDINYCQHGYFTALSGAISKNRLEAFKYLISQGADYKFIDKQGKNLLFPAVASGNLEIIKTLVELKLDVDIKVQDPIQGEVGLVEYINFKWEKDCELKREIMKLIAH